MKNMALHTRKIMAIGGGEIGRPTEDGRSFYADETVAIDREILRLTDSTAASLLFLPTASGDSKSYYDAVKSHFLKIGFKSVNVLYITDKTLTNKDIKDALLGHDAIYVGGGNTLKMMTLWRKRGVDTILAQALDKGIVLSGLSAGSICWFTAGSSDSRRFTSSSNQLINVTGLGFIDAVHCPHYDTEPHRQDDIKTKMMTSAKVAIALDNCAALEVVGDKYRIIKSKSTAKARKLYWGKGTYFVEELQATDSLQNLDSLLAK
jgi:dipeptidase E